MGLLGFLLYLVVMAGVFIFLAMVFCFACGVIFSGLFGSKKDKY